MASIILILAGLLIHLAARLHAKKLLDENLNQPVTPRLKRQLMGTYLAHGVAVLLWIVVPWL